MIEKILVEIYVPAISRSFDVFIPQTSKIGELNSLVAGAIAPLAAGKIKNTGNITLCSAEDGNILDVNKYVYQCKIKNGSTLLLI